MVAANAAAQSSPDMPECSAGGGSAICAVVSASAAAQSSPSRPDQVVPSLNLGAFPPPSGAAQDDLGVIDEDAPYSEPDSSDDHLSPLISPVGGGHGLLQGDEAS